MKSFNCPSCGAQIDFRSSVTLYMVCAYCRSVVVRNDLNVELLGKEAQLKEDSSPFAVGTQGRFGATAFTLIGRIVRAWNDGQWNEWFMLLDDQRRGWLAEAQGQLMIFFEADSALVSAAAGNQATPKSWTVGDTVLLNKQTFTVSDIKDVRCVGCEGELPRYVRPGDASHTVDLTAPPRACATIETSGDECQIYVGTFVEFEECRFQQLRAVPGW